MLCPIVTGRSSVGIGRDDSDMNLNVQSVLRTDISVSLPLGQECAVLDKLVDFTGRFVCVDETPMLCLIVTGR